MNILKLITVYILTIFIFYGCQNEDQKNAELIRGLNPTDKFISDVPTDEWRRIFLRRAENDIGLDSLVKGFDSIQIRIWNGCCGYKYKPADYWLMSLIFDKKDWKAELSDLFIEDTSPNQHDSLSRKITYRQPRSGWNDFITKLFKLKILSLPNFEQIKHYEDRKEQDSWTDGCGISIEIATKKIYRVYDYENPDYFKKNYQEAKSILEIIELLENEFAIKYEPKNSTKNSGNKTKTDN